MKRILEFLIGCLFVEPTIYKVEYQGNYPVLDKIFNHLKIESSYKRWLFQKILRKINIEERIDEIDINFIVHSLNRSFEKIKKNGQLYKEPFYISEDNLINKAELLVKKIEDFNKQIKKELGSDASNFSAIILN